MNEKAGSAEFTQAVGWEWPVPVAEEATAPLRVRKVRAFNIPI